jgi:Probable addiction module antidote protein
VKLNERSTLRDVAVAVSRALEAAGIRAVLTGGGIATIHTRGSYKSEDLDFIIQSAPTQAQLDAAWLGRESLHKALSAGGNPELGTVLRVTRALGIKLQAVPTRHVPAIPRGDEWGQS